MLAFFYTKIFICKSHALRLFYTFYYFYFFTADSSGNVVCGIARISLESWTDDMLSVCGQTRAANPGFFLPFDLHRFK